MDVFDEDASVFASRAPEWFVEMARAAIDAGEFDSLLWKRSVLWPAVNGSSHRVATKPAQRHAPLPAPPPVPFTRQLERDLHARLEVIDSQGGVAAGREAGDQVGPEGAPALTPT